MIESFNGKSNRYSGIKFSGSAHSVYGQRYTLPAKESWLDLRWSEEELKNIRWKSRQALTELMDRRSVRGKNP